MKEPPSWTHCCISLLNCSERRFEELKQIFQIWIHYCIRPVTTDFQSNSCVIWVTSAFSLFFPSWTMAYDDSSLKILNTNLKIKTTFTKGQIFLSKSNHHLKFSYCVVKIKQCVQIIHTASKNIFTTDHWLDTASNNLR